MKKIYLKFISGVVLGTTFFLVSCHSTYEVTSVEGGRVAINSSWDTHPDTETKALLAPYKKTVDSIMSRVVGTADVSMDCKRPEDLLSNLVADVLRESAVQVLGKSADIGLVNIGGLRSVLTQGPITCAEIYEILPFENALCVLTIKGVHLKQLFENIAARGGEGVSGVQLEITSEGKLLNGTVSGQAVEDDKMYTIATIDYLAEGNDGMSALVLAEKRECPDGARLRDVFMKYVEKQTAKGKTITSRMEGRIVVK